MLSEMLATTSTAVGEPAKNTKALLLSFVMLPIMLAGIQYGVEGACWAWLIITIISFCTHIKTMLPVFQVSLTEFLVTLFPSFFSAVIMLSCLQWMRFQLENSIEPWQLFALMIPCGGIVFIAIMFLLFRKQNLETINYLRHK